MAIQPYLFFEGRCDEALDFYKSALGAEVQMLLRYKDSPEPNASCPTTAPPDKVMHAQVRIGDATLLFSDGRCSGAPNFQGFGLSLTVPTEPDADRAFNALAQGGGQVRVSLAKTFFSPRFGMVADRFGVLWMVYVAPTGTTK